MANQDIVKSSIAEAMKVLVRKKGIEDISVTDICQQSQVNRRTFYRYFSDKFEVIEWIHYNDFLQRLRVPDKAGLYYLMAASTRLILEDREYYINAIKFKGQNSFRQYCSQHLRQLLSSDFRPCFSSDELYNIYISYSVETAFDFFEYYLTNKPDVTLDELLPAFRDMFYKPGKRYVELLQDEYKQPNAGSTYETAEPSRVQKKAK